MPLGAVSKAVADRLAAEWTHCPVRGPNDKNRSTPADGSPFLEVQYPVVNSTQITFGSPAANVYRDEGVIRLVLAESRGKGLVRVLGWADDLAALFRGKNFDGVRTFAPSAPVTDDRNDDGKYFLLSIAVPFEHDYLG